MIRHIDLRASYSQIPSPVTALDLDARRDQSERLYSRILGERVAIAFASELGLECRPTLMGFASAGLHDLIRQKTPQRLTQARPAIMVNDFNMRTEPDAEQVAIGFDAVTLHEVSHIVADKITAAVCRQFNGSRLREIASAPRSDEPVRIRWIDHDLRYIRGLLHVAHRVRSRGHWVLIDLTFPSTSYGLSDINKYADALGDEPAQKSWLTLADALAGPMPDDFQSLWTADVLRSLKPPVLKGQIT